MPLDLSEILAGKWEDGTRPKDLYAEQIAQRPGGYVKRILAGLCCGNRRVENGCAELASLLSEDRPELVAPYVEVFVANLDSQAKVLRWEAACTLGNLAGVDETGRVVAQVGKLIPLLREKSAVLQGHAVQALGKIALANPQAAGRVFKALTATPEAFPGNKIGFVIETLGGLAELPGFGKRVRGFVEPYLGSEVKVVAKKAARVLKRLG